VRIRVPINGQMVEAEGDADEVRAFAESVTSDRKAPVRARREPVEAPTIAELWERWATWAVEGLPSYQTRKSQRTPLMTTPMLIDGEAVTFADLRCDQVTAGHAEHYRAARSKVVSRFGRLVKGNSINNELTTLQMMLTWHVRHGTIPRNPLDGWKRENEDKYTRRTYLNEDDFFRLIAHGIPTYQDIMFVAYRCMLRNAEVRLLRKDGEIDWSNRVIHLDGARTKSRRPREVPIPADAFDVLDRHARASRGSTVFVHPQDPARRRPVTHASFWRWHDNARKASGLVGVGGEVIVIHHTRHAGVTNALEVLPAPQVAKYAGLSLRVLDKTYSKFSRVQQEKFREALDAIAPKRTPGDDT